MKTQDGRKVISMTKDEKLQAQKDQLTELQESQRDHLVTGNEIPSVEANRNPKYKVLAHEEHMVHVLATEKHDNPSTKEYVKKESIIKVHAREFDRRVNEGAFKTYDGAEVIHDPRIGAPKTYNLNPDFAKVESAGPKDSDVKTDTSGITGTNRVPAAVRPDKNKEKAQAPKEPVKEPLAPAPVAPTDVIDPNLDQAPGSDTQGQGENQGQ